ncbi:M14 family metallopeptidase [Arthrobacter sp. zg-Y179]|uniref:M14 family metallopeptidase n=1 Tax=Arthrobacter sp. zg-Y179 TaxID=2894188 RepID=UPI001E322D0C|nr:M14 family metallopeptidase [Arthrobacter sp. zg-Y179]MCC9175474.1 M14 family metallopeptidase [Arthrobacter sp. zg-Y179]
MQLRHRTAAAVVTSFALLGLTISPAAGTRVETAPASKLPDLPTPAEYFGFEMGDEGRLAAFSDISEYFETIADSSPEVEYEVVDRTTDNNEYPILRLSSEENLARLDSILAVNERLADPDAMAAEAAGAGMEPEAYARQLAQTTVPVYYIEASIHATEVGNTQALVDVVHRLATEDSEAMNRILDNLVVLVVPSANPDGQQMVVDYFNETAGTEYNRVYPDLYHRYVGHDNNRDWFMFTQKESRTRVALEQKYRPVVQHYMHQAGTESPRIWTPPYDEPLSPDVDPIAISSSNALGQFTQRDLVAEGLKGVKSDDAYGILWNADVAGYGTFLGTSTFLTEIASVRDLAYPYTGEGVLEPVDKTMRSPLPYDSDTWTLKQIVQYATSAAFSGLNTVAGDPQSWLLNNLYRVNANSETWDGGPYAYVVPADQRDPYAVYDMMRIFDFGEVEIEQATAPFTAEGREFDAGSYILRTQQPLGRWVDQLLRIDEYPDSARKCDDCPLILPYSETTDNVALFMGVDVAAVQEEFDAETRQVQAITQERIRMPRAPGADGAYILSAESYGLGRIIDALQDAGVDAYRAAGAITVDGQEFAPGALMVPAGEPRARETLTRAVRETALPVYATAAMPASGAVQLAENTRVGLVRGANNMPGGWLMWMMDQFGTNYEVVEAADYATLSEQFDTIVLAPGITTERLTVGLDATKYPEEFAWAAGVPDAPQRLAEFANQGGNVLALGSSSLTAASAMGLPVENVTPTDREVFTVPGALLAQEYDTSQPAAWGMPAAWPTWFNNDAAFRLTGAGTSVSRYPAEGNPLVSGYALGAEALNGATNIASFDVGEGEVTIAGGHITFRTWPRASWTVVTNAIYNGAGTELTAEEMAARFGG